MDNKKAHQTLTMVNRLFDDYNEHGFVETSKPLLKAWQDIAKDALNLFKFLKAKEPNSDAVNGYILFTRKLLLRFSYLLHLDRLETDKERYEHLFI